MEPTKRIKKPKPNSHPVQIAPREDVWNTLRVHAALRKMRNAQTLLYQIIDEWLIANPLDGSTINQTLEVSENDETDE